MSLRPSVTYWPVPGKRNGVWHLNRPWSHPVNGCVLSIPQGFVFDMASVPRLLWWLPGYAPMELGPRASLTHDFLYRYRGNPPLGTVDPVRTFTRREADRYFSDLMAEAGVNTARRRIAWLAVRLFGWLPWRKAPIA